MGFLNRFKYAFQGLRFLVFGDRSIQLHFLLLAGLIVFGFLFRISGMEWLSLLICSALVICLEALNTVLERIADFIHKDFHPEIKIIKDASAAIVLMACCFSVIVAGIVFIPKILDLIYAC